MPARRDCPAVRRRNLSGEHLAICSSFSPDLGLHAVDAGFEPARGEQHRAEDGQTHRDDRDRLLLEAGPGVSSARHGACPGPRWDGVRSKRPAFRGSLPCLRSLSELVDGRRAQGSRQYANETLAEPAPSRVAADKTNSRSAEGAWRRPCAVSVDPRHRRCRRGARPVPGLRFFSEQVGCRLASPGTHDYHGAPRLTPLPQMPDSVRWPSTPTMPPRRIT